MQADPLELSEDTDAMTVEQYLRAYFDMQVTGRPAVVALADSLHQVHEFRRQVDEKVASFEAVAKDKRAELEKM